MFLHNNIIIACLTPKLQMSWAWKNLIGKSMYPENENRYWNSRCKLTSTKMSKCDQDFLFHTNTIIHYLHVSQFCFPSCQCHHHHHHRDLELSRIWCMHITLKQNIFYNILKYCTHYIRWIWVSRSSLLPSLSAHSGTLNAQPWFYWWNKQLKMNGSFEKEPN